MQIYPLRACPPVYRPVHTNLRHFRLHPRVQTQGSADAYAGFASGAG